MTIAEWYAAMLTGLPIPQSILIELIETKNNPVLRKIVEEKINKIEAVSKERRRKRSMGE